jgi:hypothetical protein
MTQDPTIKFLMHVGKFDTQSLSRRGGSTLDLGVISHCALRTAHCATTDEHQSVQSRLMLQSKTAGVVLAYFLGKQGVGIESLGWGLTRG